MPKRNNRPSLFTPNKCLEHGIDITKDLIPVSPAAHYFMGGIKVATSGKTDIKNLFASGEVSCTSLHGANRLASNSLLECVVCADLVASKVEENSNNFDEFTQNQIEKYSIQRFSKIENVKELRSEIQDIMWNYVGIIRDEKSLSRAINELDRIANDIDLDGIYSTSEEYEIINMLTVCRIIAKMALQRKESRGAHYRCDYPQKAHDALNQFYREGKTDDKIFVA